MFIAILEIIELCANKTIDIRLNAWNYLQCSNKNLVFDSNSWNHLNECSKNTENIFKNI